MGKMTLLSASALRSAAFAGAFVFVGVSPAFAQSTANPPVAAPTTPDCTIKDPGTPVDPACASDSAPSTGPGARSADNSADIVVTGSRIRRNQYNTGDPIQIINREEATQAGFASTSQILQSTAVTNGTGQINNSFGGFVTAGGPGANTVSLRGLGTTRTLVLLNGRRIAPAGSRGQVGAADLNVLPNAILDRIEVLNTGASSIYGSDAVAGVVNLVTLNKIKGLTIEAQANVPEVGAGVSKRISAVFGHQGPRFHFAGSLEYYDQTPLKLYDRQFTRCQTSYRNASPGAAPDTGSYIDPRTGQAKCYPTGATGESGVTINTIGTPNISSLTVARDPGVPASYTGVCNRFRPNPLVTTGALPGYECVGGGTLNLSIRDTFDPRILNQDILSPVRTYTGFAQASYEVGGLGDAEIYTEVLANRRKSSQTGFRQFSFDYPVNSPLIPANLRFATPFLGANQPNNTAGRSAVGIRVFAPYGNYANFQTVDFVRGLVGIRGNLGFKDWHYDVWAGRSWSDSSYSTESLLTDRLQNSFDVVQNANGTFSCRSAAPGCVPAPALTPAVIAGNFPAAFLGYVSQITTGVTKFRESTVSGSIDGSLFSLPEAMGAGTIRIALGAEYRKDSLNDTPDINSQLNNLYGFTSSTITRGTDSTKEVFGEIEIPLLRNLPFAYNLTLNGSARYTDYRSYGSNTTYRINGLYSPVRWLSFRGGYGTSFRAPALFEQFLGATTGFLSQQNDPCNNYDAPGVSANVAAACLSEGLPSGFQATSSITSIQRGGAETGLAAETSRNYTIGGVIQPKFGRFGDLAFSVDYFNVRVDNGVSQVSTGSILNTCYNQAGFRSAGGLCNLVVRSSTAPFALTVTTGYVNIAENKVAGYDFNLRYNVRLTGDTTLRLNAAVTDFTTRYFQTFRTDPKNNVIGTLNNPKWSGTFSAALTKANWTFRWNTDWLQHTNVQRNRDFIFGAGTPESTYGTYNFDVPDFYIHSASVRYQNDAFGMTVGVRNIFDRDPPQISSGAYNRLGNAPLYSGYQDAYTGRQFFVNVTRKF